MTRRAILILVALTLAACTPAQMRLWDEAHGFAPGTTETVVANIRAQEAADAARRPSTPAAIIRDVFGAEGNRAVRVATCESELNPRAVNPSSGASGLFQVMPQWAHRYREVTGLAYYDGRFDPYANTRFALYLWRDTGSWSHWVCRP